MNASRIAPPTELGQRRPRIRDEHHLAFIRTLGCCVCGKEPVIAAHVRMASPEHSKRETGKSEKPSDCWVVPLCPGCHTDGPDAQHRSGETEWWNRQGIGVLELCDALHAATGDYDAAMDVIRRMT